MDLRRSWAPLRVIAVTSRPKGSAASQHAVGTRRRSPALLATARAFAAKGEGTCGATARTLASKGTGSKGAAHLQAVSSWRKETASTGVAVGPVLEKRFQHLANVWARGSRASFEEVGSALRFGRCEEAPLLLARLWRSEGPKPTARTYTCAVQACGRASRWDLALALVSDLRSRHGQVDTILLNAVISTCARGHVWTRALVVFEAMRSRGPQPDDVSLAATVGACAQGARWRQALALCDEMALAQLRTCVVAQNASMTACERGSEWQTALWRFASLKRLRLSPDVVSYGAAISATAKGYGWASAVALLAEMRQKLLVANGIVYSAAITACEKGREWQLALLLFGALRRRGDPDVVAYNAAISACEKGFQWRLALRLLGLLLDCQPKMQRGSTPRATSTSCNAAISACEKGHRWEHALWLLDMMQQEQVRPDEVTYNAAISACEKAHRWEEGIALLTRMGKFQLSPNLIAFNALMSACSHGREWALALAFFEESKARDLRPDSVSYNSALVACSLALRWEQAQRLLVASAPPAPAAAPARGIGALASLAAARERGGLCGRLQVVVQKLLLEYFSCCLPDADDGLGGSLLSYDPSYFAVDGSKGVVSATWRRRRHLLDRRVFAPVVLRLALRRPTTDPVLRSLDGLGAGPTRQGLYLLGLAPSAGNFAPGRLARCSADGRARAPAKPPVEP
eukprot:TRINITY_DN11481_c0_g1_i1.p1 TRINITY_DN11481_c0_g1~~TRINITY_DN11481_c0_g1_i1.p1  ORF type:complete len:755 (-),score=126.78 TRINITY_DN11481_c0_g1_i1:26-2095(-)